MSSQICWKLHLLIFYRIFYGIFHTQVERISRNLNPVECWRSPVVNTRLVLDKPSPVYPNEDALQWSSFFQPLKPQNHGERTTPKTSHPHLPTLGSKISYLNDCLRYTLSNMHRHVDLNLNAGNMIYIYNIIYYILCIYIYIIIHIIYM